MDVQDLTNSFRDLQRLLHPDKFSNKSEVKLGNKYMLVLLVGGYMYVRVRFGSAEFGNFSPELGSVRGSVMYM